MNSSWFRHKIHKLICEESVHISKASLSLNIVIETDMDAIERTIMSVNYLSNDRTTRTKL